MGGVTTGVAGQIETLAGHFPLVVIVWGDDFSFEALEMCMRENEVLLERGARFVTVRDARRVKTLPPALVRRAMAEWEQAHAKLIAERVVGVVNVIDAPVIAAGLRAVHWVSTPPCPEVVVPTLPEGIAWAMQRLRDEGVNIPPQTLRFAEGIVGRAL